MPSQFYFTRSAVPDPDFYRLHGARPDGVVVARYFDQDVTDAIIDEEGRRYIFTGLVPRWPDGRYDVRGLEAGEMVLDPGLIYKLVPVRRRFFFR